LKLIRLGLVAIFCVVLLGLVGPVTWANGEDTTEVTGNVVAPPSVITRFAWPLGWKGAILYGKLTDMGSASSVDVYFEWGTDTNYGFTTESRTRIARNHFWAVIMGLTPGTTYHFRAVAVGDGTSYGEDRSFTARKIGWWRWLY